MRADCLTILLGTTYSQRKSATGLHQPIAAGFRQAIDDDSAAGDQEFRPWPFLGYVISHPVNHSMSKFVMHPASHPTSPPAGAVRPGTATIRRAACA